MHAVRAYLAPHPEVRLHTGVFPETAGALANRRFSFVHVDAVLYRSVLSACEFFYPRLVTGGVMVFDDYLPPHCPGEKRAVDEFFAGTPDTPILMPTRQCIVHRLGAARPSRCRTTRGAAGGANGIIG